MMKKKGKKMMNNSDKNANIVKSRVSMILRVRDFKFWERSEKNNILRKRNFLSLVLKPHFCKMAYYNPA